MQSIRQVQRLNDIELEKCVPPNASWHTDYRDTAYIYIGGIPFELSEGDILTIFSQYGNPVHVNLVRDKETGKSRGFAFLKYEDQRSCDLAVDNLSGAGVMGRVVSVDHTRYKMKEGEVEGLGLEDAEADGGGESSSGGEEEGRRTRPLIKEEVELRKLMEGHDEDDPMKGYLIEEKKAEVKAALKRREKEDGQGRKHRSRRDEDGHRSRRDDDDGKRRHRSRRDDDDREDDGRDKRSGHASHRDYSDEERSRHRHRSRRDRSESPDRRRSPEEQDRRPKRHRSRNRS